MGVLEAAFRIAAIRQTLALAGGDAVAPLS